MAEPFLNSGLVTLYRQDARQAPLPDQSVHCIVTSPPYYMLRQYKDVDQNCLGNEPTPEQYISNLMQVMGECQRVLRQDGICWVNLKDTWAGSGVANETIIKDGAPKASLSGRRQGCLFGVPELFIQAMVRAGWVHRDTIIWDKSVVKPESVHGVMWVKHQVKTKARPPEGWDIDYKTRPGGDLGSGNKDAQWADCPGCAKCLPNEGLVKVNGSWRTTSKHELLFMFVKKMGYWADGEAVRTPVKSSSLARISQNGGRPIFNPNRERDQLGEQQETLAINQMVHETANRRSIWNDIKASPNMDGVHFASFSPDLPRLCIQASTSEKGCCPDCGAGWARVVEKQPSTMNIRVRDAKAGRTEAKWLDAPASALEVEEYGVETMGETRTVGWRAVCDCGKEEVVPALVLDPFVGTGTTCLSAMRLGRRSVGLDLSQLYLDYAARRLQEETLPLALGW